MVTSNPVYATNQALLADGVGRRLENFFWRIWSSADIRDHIRGSQVAVLFSKISEGGSLRTTPTQSPRTSRSLGSYRQTSYSDNALNSSPPTARVMSSQSQRSSSGAAEENERNMGPLDDPASCVPGSMKTSQQLKKEVSLPPSILKKSRAESSSQLSKNTTILSPTIDSLRRNPSSGSGEAVTTSGSPFSEATGTGKGGGASRHEQLSSSSQNEKRSSVSSSKSKVPPSESRTLGAKTSRLSGEDQKPARTKPAIHAKTGASRRRPVMASRKPSQSSSSNALNVISPSSGKKVASSSEPPDPDLNADARSRWKAQLHRSKHDAQDTADDESSSSDEEEEECADNGENRPDDSLVDRDFRSKFASRIRPEPPLPGSLPPLERKPAQALADSAPYTTRFSGKSKRNVGFTDEIISLKPPGASAEEDEDDTPGVLPRTKSHLTLLLEQDRRKSGGENTPRKAGRR